MQLLRWERLAGAVVATTAFALAQSAAVLAAPVGASQTQTWSVGTPACRITQGWRERPTAVKVQRVDFTGTVWCASVPSNLNISGQIQVSDVEAGLDAPPVARATGWMGPSPTPESFSMTPVLDAPKAGHQYLYQLGVEFTELFNPYVVDGVENPPPQCTYHSNDPFSTGPIFTQPYVDCEFEQVINVL